MELMVCSDLVGGTTEQRCIFTDLTCYYKWYEILLKFLHLTSAMPQPFWLLIGANLALAGFLAWKWSLWPVPAWLVVQRIKAFIFLTLYDSKIIWNTSKLSAFHLSRATAIFVVDCCQFGPSCIFWLKMELMACAGWVGVTTEKRCIFPDLIW